VRWQPAPFSRIARVSDLETRFIAYNSLVREYTSETFANGSVPTGMSSVPTMCVASPTSTFVERVVSLYGELGVDARLMKFSSADYTYVDTIFTRPALAAGRFVAGIISARPGDGGLRQEWIVGPSSASLPRAYYTPPPWVGHVGPRGGHTNELAAIAFKTSEFGAWMNGRHARVADHWPTREQFGEQLLRDRIDAAQMRARAVRRRP